MTETAAMADIVLPATTFLEHDDIYTAGGHTYLQIGRAVVPPHAECRSNHDVICALAERLGAQHPAFRDDRASRSSSAPCTPAGCPARKRSRTASGSIAGPAFETGHFLDGFGHPDKKFHFRADWRRSARSMRSCPPSPTMSRHRRRRSRTAVPPGRRAVALVPQHQLQQHALEHRPRGPADRARSIRRCWRELGIADGDRVRIGNRRGSVVVHARAFDGLQRRVVDRRRAVAQPCLRGGHRDQSVDQRRSRPAARRRGVPRYLGVAEPGVRGEDERRQKPASERVAFGRGRAVPRQPEAGAAGASGGGRGRLIFALDATASREPTWDRACRIQGEMFEATAALGGLEIQLVFYRGFSECKASRWMTHRRRTAPGHALGLLRRRRDPDRAGAEPRDPRDPSRARSTRWSLSAMRWRKRSTGCAGSPASWVFSACRSFCFTRAATAPRRRLSSRWRACRAAPISASICRAPTA